MGSEERLSILNMLAEGKITVAEAERLLRALGDSGGRGAGPEEGEAEGARATARQARGWKRPRERPEVADLVDDIGAEVRRAVRSVQSSDIGRTVSREVSRALASLQRADLAGMASDIVEQVREAVSDAVERSPGAKVEEEQQLGCSAEGCQRLCAETVSGGIQVTGAETDRIAVRATKRVRGRDQAAVDSFAAELVVCLVEEGERVRLYHEPPRPPQGVQAEVHYQITCPHRLAVELRLVNGNVGCTGMRGGVDLQGTNGNVRVDDCAGPVRASTRNGNARARILELRTEAALSTTNGNVEVEVCGGQGQLDASSRNGNVHARLPRDTAGELEARTTNGTVVSELELASVTEQKRNVLVGRLGDGPGGRLRLVTQNGNVRLAALGGEESQP